MLQAHDLCYVRLLDNACSPVFDFVMNIDCSLMSLLQVEREKHVQESVAGAVIKALSWHVPPEWFKPLDTC